MLRVSPNISVQRLSLYKKEDKAIENGVGPINISQHLPLLRSMQLLFSYSCPVHLKTWPCARTLRTILLTIVAAAMPRA